MKIVQLSNYDYTGSGYRIKQSIERVSKEVKVTCVVADPSVAYERHGHDIGIFLNRHTFKQVKREISQADVIHFKGDNLPQKSWQGIDVPNIPVIITLGGSGFRRGKSKVAQQWHPIADYVKCTQLRTVNTPDLNYPELKGYYTPLPIDSLSKPMCVNHDDDLFTVMHSPSTRSKKGTDKIIIPAMNNLNPPKNVLFEIIEGLPHWKCVERKSQASVFIDQIGMTGIYGNNGVESMQFGIPTIASISDQAREQSQGIYDNLPVISCEDIYDLKAVLLYLMDNKEVHYKLSLKTKAYCDRVHSLESVGAMWLNLLRKL